MKIVNIIVLLLFFYYFYSLLKKNTKNNQNQNLKNKINKIEPFKMFCDEDIENTHKIKDYLAKINSASKIPQLKYTNFAIPYNFNDNLDNNVLYNNGVKDINKRLKYEKKLYGSVRPRNSNLLKNNYNKDMEPFKKIPNYYYHYKNKDKCVKSIVNNDQLECNENLDNFISANNLKIQLLSRWISDEDKIYLNWSIPICNSIRSIVIYFKNFGNPDKCLTLKDLRLNTFEKYEIPYQKLTLKQDLHGGIYRQYKNIGRLICNYTTSELSKNNKYLFYVGVKFDRNKKISNLVEI